MRCTLRLFFPAVLALACLLAGRARAVAMDSASLQFTVPAPDPVNAGETLSLQALAINTGDGEWEAGSYFWVAEIYDLEEHLVARTEQVSPPEKVAKGGVAAVSLPFSVPETMLGRHLYRLFLVKDSRTIVESEFKPFQVLPKPIPEAPKQVDYRVEGNVTVSYKNSSRNQWTSHSGATTINAVGKLKESSYLFNAYLLHQVGKAVDPYIILLTYYAPWGTVYGGDIAPTLGELSVNGQGLRGGQLEQRRGDWGWTVLGGQTVTSQPGTTFTNGRFARTLYAGKLDRTLPTNLNIAANYFLCSDEPGSLSTDPGSTRYRGPDLKVQKNSGYGLTLKWEPVRRLAAILDYQANKYFADTSAPGVSDKAWRGEFRWERQYFKLRTYVQRAGPKFAAFGAPSVVGDKLTYSASLNLFPASWYTLGVGGYQDRDNLANNPDFSTTQQRLLNMSHSLQFRSGTSLSLTGSMNTAQGKPLSVLNNKTTSAGVGVSQSMGRHNVALNAQASQFRDITGNAPDMDTVTTGVSTSFALPGRSNLALGVTRSQTKDKREGSQRASLTASPSFSKPLWRNVVGQFWGSYNSTKNTSPSAPYDVTTLGVNSEFTWSQTKFVSWTGGVGMNRYNNKLSTTLNYNELTVSTRVSVSF